MGNGQGKSSESFSGAFKHGSRSSIANDSSSRSKVLWLEGWRGSASGRLSVFSDRVSSVAQWSWRSGRSAASTVANWPRRASTQIPTHGSRWSALKSGTLKTNWPVSLTESLFLPEFPVRQKHSQRQFDVISTLGSGAYGKVYHVRDKKSAQEFALKVLSKSQVVRENAVGQVVRENAVGQVKDEVCIQTACGHHRFIVSCPQRWQTRRQIYVLEQYICGGDMYSLWMKHCWLHEKLVQVFVGQLAVAIEFLHNAGVVYRDLKLQNVLLDADMNVQLTDFGLAKWLRHGHRTSTICGTLSYMAPEILDMQPYTHCVDWWSLGVMTHCLLTGQFPFEGSSGCDSEDGDEGSCGAAAGKRDDLSPDPSGSDQRLLQRRAVLTSQLTLPARVSEPARHLVRRLLTVEPRHRLSSLLQLSRQGWFKGVNVDVIGNGQAHPRSLYEELHPVTTSSGVISDSNLARPASDDFIDFDASTVADDDSGQLGAGGDMSLSELREEFPLLPRRVPTAGDCVLRELCSQSGDGPCMTSTPVRQIRRVEPPVTTTSSKNNIITTAMVTPIDRTSESTSGDLLELCLPVDCDVQSQVTTHDTPTTARVEGRCLPADELKETTLPQFSIEKQTLSVDKYLDEFHIKEEDKQRSDKLRISRELGHEGTAPKPLDSSRVVDQRFAMRQCGDGDIVNSSSSAELTHLGVEKRISFSDLDLRGLNSLVDFNDSKTVSRSLSKTQSKPHTSYEDITEGLRVGCLSINDKIEKDAGESALKGVVARKFIGDFFNKERLLGTCAMFSDRTISKTQPNQSNSNVDYMKSVTANQVADNEYVTRNLSNQNAETDRLANQSQPDQFGIKDDKLCINNESVISKVQVTIRRTFTPPPSQSSSEVLTRTHHKKSSSLNNIVGGSLLSGEYGLSRGGIGGGSSNFSHSDESVLCGSNDVMYKRMRSFSEDDTSTDLFHLSKRARHINSTFN